MLGLRAARAIERSRRIEVGKPRHPRPSLAQGTGRRLAGRHGRRPRGAGQAPRRKAQPRRPTISWPPERGRATRLRRHRHVDRRGGSRYAGRGAQRERFAPCATRGPRPAASCLGDVIRQTGRDDFGGHSEAYVCPKGFDGTYRMLVRRVWGNVTAGKVNVEVITHYRAPDAVDVRKKIALDKDEAIVGVRPERRTPQGADSASSKWPTPSPSQLALNRQILAQQLAAAVDPRRHAAHGRLAGRRAKRQRNRHLGGLLGARRLPAGHQWSARRRACCGVTAVVSADRRYVRITPAAVLRRVAGQHVQYVHRRKRRRAASGQRQRRSSGGGATRRRRRLSVF